MAQPAPSRRPTREHARGDLPFDPHAAQRAYRLQRRRRRAKRDRIRERRLAAVRFAVVLFALLALSIFLTLTAWREVQRLFGL